MTDHQNANLAGADAPAAVAAQALARAQRATSTAAAASRSAYRRLYLSLGAVFGVNLAVIRYLSHGGEALLGVIVIEVLSFVPLALKRRSRVAMKWRRTPEAIGASVVGVLGLALYFAHGSTTTFVIAEVTTLGSFGLVAGWGRAVAVPATGDPTTTARRGLRLAIAFIAIVIALVAFFAIAALFPAARHQP